MSGRIRAFLAALALVIGLPAAAQAASTYVSSLTALSSPSLTDTYYVCQTNTCGLGAIGDRESGLQILSLLSASSPLSYNGSTATLSMVNSGVTPGSYTSANITVSATGQITAAANGSGGGGITALTGPVTASGSGSVATTITPTGVTAGSYTSANITVNAAGQVTAAANGSGGSGVAGPGSSVNTDIATWNGTGGNTLADGGILLANLATLSGGHLLATEFPALTGDLTTAAGALATTLATVNSNIGTFASETVNGKGLVTAAGNLSGDLTTSGAAATLATVNSNVGSFTSANITVNAKGLVTAAANGSGSTTTITAAPGLGNSLTSFNGTGAAQTVTNASTLYPQAGTYTVSAAYSLNATTGTTPCTTSVLCDLARTILANGSASIAITAPNPAGTLWAYQIADIAGHGFTVPTVGGTATFFGCVTGSPTTLTVPANYGVQLFDQGSSANTYLCTLQPITQVATGGLSGMTTGQVPIAATATTVTSSQAVGTTGNSTILETGSGGQIATTVVPGSLVNALTDGTTITVPAITGAGALDTVTLGGSHAFANPASMSGTQAQSLVLDVLENGTGGFTPTWGSEFIFASGTPIFNTAANALNVVSCVTVPSLTQLHCLGPTAPPPAISLSWAPGQNLAGATNGIGIHTASLARTITGVSCRIDTAAGGTATIAVWIAPSGTAYTSGTAVTTTSCNANGAGLTNQTGLASASVSVPAGDTIGIVATGAGWTSSVGAGSISVSVQ